MLRWVLLTIVAMIVAITAIVLAAASTDVAYVVVIQLVAAVCFAHLRNMVTAALVIVQTQKTLIIATNHLQDHLIKEIHTSKEVALTTTTVMTMLLAPAAVVT